MTFHPQSMMNRPEGNSLKLLDICFAGFKRADEAPSQYHAGFAFIFAKE
jgi:hypothetical protein